MPEMDTREAVAAAFKEVQSREAAVVPEPSPEPAETAAPAPATESAPAKEPAQEGAPQRDDKGRFVPGKPAASEKPPAAPKGATGAAGQSGAAAPPMAAAPLAAPSLEALKPPQNLRALAREKWSAWPREAQEEFVRLHHETSRTLAESTATRKAWEAHQQVISPYEGMIRAEGLEPAQAVGLLLQREQALRTAPMQTRAQIIAHGIRSFLGTDDAAIGLLAEALNGQSQQGAPHPPQQFDPNQLIAQAEQRLMQRLETSRNQSLSESATSELEAFSQSHEFLDEPDPETGLTLAEDMANLMAAAADRDKALSFDDAYKIAAKRHSVVNGIVQQREAARAATAKAATAQQARAASSTLRSEPAGPANGKPKDTRELVAQAYFAQKNAH